MKIKKVYIKDYKNLQEFSADLDGKSILLMGKNGVGKSSFEQFCKIGFGYKPGTDPNLTIDGELIVDKDGIDYKIKVSKEEGVPVKRTITSMTGVKQTSTSWLKSFTGAIEFNPELFVEKCKTEAGRKECIEMLKSFRTPEEVQIINILANDYKLLFEQRTETNRVVENLKGYIGQCNFNGAVEEPKSTSELVSQLTSINALNERIGKANKALNDYEEKETEIKEKISQLNSELQLIKEKKSNAIVFLQENDIKDVSLISEEISRQDFNQKKYHEYLEFIKKQQELEEMKSLSDTQTEKLEQLKEERLNKIKGENSVLEGLEIKEEGFYYKGKYVDDKSMSTSELMMLSWLLKFAENPDMPQFIERGESLDKEKRKALFDLVQQKEIQLVLEMVDPDGDQMQIQYLEGVE